MFTPLTKAVRAFFKSDVRLQRADGGLRVVFDDKPATAAKRQKPPLDPRAERERRDAQHMRAALTTLLDEVPQNRQALRHLAFFEQALAKKGARSFQKVPYEVMQQALAQLEGLVVNWSDEGLACLRSKMAVALIEREVEQTHAEEHHTRALIEPCEPPQAVALEGDAAAEAEAALLAAYGAVALPGLDLSAPAEAAEEPAAVELHGELSSPSARALNKAKGRSESEQVDLRLRELQS